MPRIAVAAWLVVLVALPFGSAIAQVALTKEEIEKEIKVAPKVAGEITLDGKRLCTFDSDNTSSYPWRFLNSGESRPGSWAVVKSTPRIVFKLSTGPAEGITLTRLRGGSDSTLMVLERAGQGSTYTLRFLQSAPVTENAPGPGDYEFGTLKGSLAFFFRCGFTIE